MKGTLYLINRVHSLSGEPFTEVLVSARSGQTEARLHQRAKVMSDQLLVATGSAGAIAPVSGYRPQAEQQATWENALAEHDKVLTETYVAHPGYNEHQAELAVDLGENGPEVDFLYPVFPDSGPYEALRHRAADFGFILRRPREEEDATSIGYKPWHFRYVGRPHARLTKECHLVLKEYLEWLHDLPLGGEPPRLRRLGRLPELYYLSVWAADILTLLADVPCQCCDTNEDGVVLTLWRDAG